MIPEIEYVNGIQIVLEPGDATRYVIVFFQTRQQSAHQLWGVAFPENWSAGSFILAEHSLEIGRKAIEGLDVNKRVSVGPVEWLAADNKINPYTAAAVYEAYDVMRKEAGV